MKKLLILMMVASVASLASAGIQIGINGETALLDSEVVLVPSDTITLQLIADPGEVGQAMFLTIEGPADVEPGVNYVNQSPILPLAPGLFQIDTIIPGSEANPIEGIIADVILHCAGEGDVTVLLGPAPSTDMLDKLIIHQIPEPMTMALLGLGGLFLRRRK